MAYRRVLVPLDGSDMAERAIPYAKTIAKSKGSEVILFTVSIASVEQLDRPMKAYLELNAKELQSQGIKASTAIAYGNVADEIVGFADKNNIDLIIISTHGYSGIKRWVLGSVARNVLYGTGVQVLLIKSKAPKVSHVELKKLLLPLDGSPFAEAPFPFIEELTKGTKTEIVLTTVSEPPLVPSYGDHPINPAWKKHRDALWAETQQQASEYLEKLKARLEKQGMKIKSQVIPGDLGRVAESIMQTAQREKVDLIVMAPHGRSGVSRWVYGGVANRIVEQSAQPVLLIRPSRPEES
ncbi:MAG: universal stress protein [Dehalococcoidia bacterium]|nr:universal stress protein [Dehalococcoidia bacterium]